MKLVVFGATGNTGVANGEAYTADIADIADNRRRYPALLTFEQYLRRNGWENAEPVAIPANTGGWGS